MQAASSNTLLQTIVDEDKRGRVMSLFAMAFMGMAPVGSLLAGSVATEIGIRWTLALAGVVCIAAGGVFALHLKAIRPLIRPIYIAKGILPAVVADPPRRPTCRSTNWLRWGTLAPPSQAQSSGMKSRLPAFPTQSIKKSGCSSCPGSVAY